MDESHDTQILLGVGLEGWDEEMMERERENAIVPFLAENANCCKVFSVDLGRMPGEFLNGKLLAFQLTTIQLVCVAVVTSGQLSSINHCSFLLNLK